jgi:uncharacterized membrane protein YadS
MYLYNCNIFKVDTFIVFYLGFLIGNLLKIDRKVSIVMSGAATICGVILYSIFLLKKIN